MEYKEKQEEKMSIKCGKNDKELIIQVYISLKRT